MAYMNRAVSAFTRGTRALPVGAGGRSSVSGHVATVFGATGFVGRYVVNRLGRIGSQMVIPFRGDEHDYRHLKPMGDLGQIHFVPYSLLDEAALKKLVKYSSVVVNLVGKDQDTRNFSLEDVHIDAPRMMARAAREAGVERFIHVSALGASKVSASRVLRAKAYGEENVLAEFPTATIIRPSNIVGTEDRFFNKLAVLRRQQFVIPLPNNGTATKRPIYVGDVALAILNAINDPQTAGKAYELVGDRQFTLEELAEFVCNTIHYPIRNLPLPEVATPLLLKAASIFELSPWNPPFNRDDIERWTVSDALTPKVGQLQDLGVTPTAIEKVTLSVLRRYRSYLTQEQALD